MWSVGDPWRRSWSRQESCSAANLLKSIPTAETGKDEGIRHLRLRDIRRQRKLWRRRRWRRGREKVSATTLAAPGIWRIS